MMRKFRLRGLVKVNIQGPLIVTEQNIKRLLQAIARKNDLDPGNTLSFQPICHSHSTDGTISNHFLTLVEDFFNSLGSSHDI
jgi:hypothetical protein